MNKGELIEAIAKVTCTKAEAAKELATTLDAITKSLKKGNPVTLIVFGTFKVSKRKARIGRNTQTGKPLKVKAKKVPVFKAGAALKKAVK